ncbi:hypothetical protein NBH19_00575 [Rhizobium sp. S95]|uniref:Uncharacterized protein n=1 Tax=Ciceribacter sichuanensis TaxID=2949647 RepID=A0AAJ1BYT9_9HYPH|nr:MULTISPECIES: hypothetical protein [unclassified Ciceribacter]MCM2394569.1 hypothetical protein [Ciceribacter sp. S95]MCM2402663.1 hypothetical protein [Ciceribacter sp. S153]MCO5958724.1 hypothetical protein [Ciceribacter sp. S101]
METISQGPVPANGAIGRTADTGTTELQFVAVFKAAEYQEVSLSSWPTHTPPALVAQRLNISLEDLARFPADRPAITPG